MARRNLLFSAFCIIAVSAFSQIRIAGGNSADITYKELDKGVIRLFYEANSVKDPEKADVLTKDYMVLELGENEISRFYSDNVRRLDSILMEVRGKVPGRNFNLDLSQMMKENGLSSGGSRGEIYKNYPQGKISVVDNVVSDYYLYEEGMDLFSWNILPETKEILSYQCQKAETDFRGRHYEAWFAMDLPINNGPWKFNGLPGLILSVSDSEGHFSFEAIGLEHIDYPILFSERKYIKTSREDLTKVQERFARDPMGFIGNSMGGATVVKAVAKDGSEIDLDNMKRPHNPIELE